MDFNAVSSTISIIVAVSSLLFTIYHTTKKTKKYELEKNEQRKKIDQERAVESAKSEQIILTRLDNLASKDYLDQKLKEEIGTLEKGLKTQIDDLKQEVKEQINEIKHDIKSQQEITENIGKELIRNAERTDSAHERITTMDKRIDDLKEFFVIQSKKPIN